MRQLTTIDLDIITAGGCEAPGCTHKHEPDMYIHAACHIQAQIQVRYDTRDKMLHLECGICDKPVATIRVAEPQ